MDDNKQFANQFVELWQENFEKMIHGSGNMSQMQQVLETMQGFYAGNDSNEQASAADADAHGDGNTALLVSALSRRIDELEARIADLEGSCK